MASNDKKSSEIFDDQIHRHSRPVVELCFFALESQQYQDFPCRDFLNHLHRESARLEELVDQYGAQNNERWFPFRESIAAAKLFADVTYSVKHIESALGRYKLAGNADECVTRTNEALRSLKEAVMNISHSIIEQAKRCGVLDDVIIPTFEPCNAESDPYRLEPDRSIRHVPKVGEVVVYLATMFLNLYEDPDVRTVLRGSRDRNYAEQIPDPISEERLRIVEARFHNLQSLYDTYVFESDIEKQNPALRVLRSHIGLIFHLMSTATRLAHYYIRHMSALRRSTETVIRHPMSREALLDLLFTYPLHMSGLFLDSAVQVCQEMIRSYSTEARIEVPIPYYRGFHVRPSTLVARIVAHYGSSVTMCLDDQEYNAGSTLDLFRANEAINAAKRRHIADMLARDTKLNRMPPRKQAQRDRELQLLFVRLMKEKRLVIYDNDLDLDERVHRDDATIGEIAAQLIMHYISVAKMDVRSDITVTFIGDSRALKDLEILARHGYGEDEIGNNIVLPEELSYLAR